MQVAAGVIPAATGTTVFKLCNTPESSTGTWVTTMDSASFCGFYYYCSSGLINEKLSFKVALATGTYTIRIGGSIGTAAPILTVKLDGSSIATLDLYAAAPTKAQVVEQTGVSIAPAAAVQTLELCADSKHASSSDYHTAITYIEFIRTA